MTMQGTASTFIALSHDARALRKARWAVRAQFLAVGLVAGMWGAHIPSVKRSYGLSEGPLAWVLLAIGLGAVMTLLVAGRVVGRWGTRRTSQVTVCLLGSSLALALHWQAGPMLWAAMVVFGASMSLLDVAINTEGSTLELLGKRPIMGNLHGSFSVGGMLGALLAGSLMHAGVAAAVQLAVTGAVVGLAAALSARAMLNLGTGDAASPELLPASADASAASSASSALPASVVASARALRRPLWLLGLLCFAGLAIEGAMYDWGVLYLLQHVKLPQAQAAWGYAAFAGAMAVARLSGDAVRQRWDEARLLRAGGYLSAMAMACVLWIAQPWAAFVGFALMGTGLAMVVPMLFNAAARLPGLDRASAIATVSVIGYTGFLLGPPVIGTLAEHAGLSRALTVLVPMAALLGWGARYMTPLPKVSAVPRAA